MRVLILHAYSAKNSGDGLLVELTAKLVREAIGESVSITVVTADPASFPDFKTLPAPILAAEGWLKRALQVPLLMLPTKLNPLLKAVQAEIANASLVIGVGGGYLRALGFMEALKLQIGHMTQLRMVASNSGAKTVYLSQSIGPIRGNLFVRKLLKLQLAKMAAVLVRDNRSEEYLLGLPSVARVPDLAVLELAERASLVSRPLNVKKISHVALVLRSPPRGWGASKRNSYLNSLRALIESLSDRCRVSFAVQSEGRGNDDLQFYAERGLGSSHPTLIKLIETDRPDLVISVRLHGALESLLQGVPAFHLSYERKGFGAYEDLGVENWVANSAQFSPIDVMETIFADGAVEEFWVKIEGRTDEIGRKRRDVVKLIKRVSLSCGPS